eukprot:2907797-Alexandrium_andersonii.AAC.1
MGLAALPPTLTPRGNPLDVILDFLLQRRATEAGAGGRSYMAPVPELLQECGRRGFSSEEAADALETWRRLGLVSDTAGGTFTLRESQLPASLPDAWVGSAPPEDSSSTQVRRIALLSLFDGVGIARLALDVALRRGRCLPTLPPL